MCGGRVIGVDFGCLKCTKSILSRKYGWIECKSTSFPGKVYYFHTMTRCSTWRRPVPRNTKLPRYNKWRDFKTSEFPRDNQNLLSPLGFSDIEGSLLSSNVPQSNFELHARRMQIYLEKNVNYNIRMKYGMEEILRDQMRKFYKTTTSQLVEKLKKKKPQTRTTKVTNDKPKTRPTNPVKTIRECHGIKTISYDSISRELPIGLKFPDLNETSGDSFGPNQDFERMKIFG